MSTETIKPRNTILAPWLLEPSNLIDNDHYIIKELNETHELFKLSQSNYWLTFFNELLENHNGFIAGGAFKDIYLNKVPKDFDVFFKTEDDFNEALKNYVDDPVFTEKYANSNTVAFANTNNKVIELIRTRFGNVTDVLDSFDFTVCKYAIVKHNNKLYSVEHASFHDDVRNKSIKISRNWVLPANNDPLDLIERIKRYLGYTFQLNDPETISIIAKTLNLAVPGFKREHLTNNPVLFFEDFFLQSKKNNGAGSSFPVSFNKESRNILWKSVLEGQVDNNYPTLIDNSLTEDSFYKEGKKKALNLKISSILDNDCTSYLINSKRDLHSNYLDFKVLEFIEKEKHCFTENELKEIIHAVTLSMKEYNRILRKSYTITIPDNIFIYEMITKHNNPVLFLKFLAKYRYERNQNVILPSIEGWFNENALKKCLDIPLSFFLSLYGEELPLIEQPL